MSEEPKVELKDSQPLIFTTAASVNHTNNNKKKHQHTDSASLLALNIDSTISFAGCVCIDLIGPADGAG